MSPTRFSVVLDNATALYFPGQMVTGKVDLSLEENVEIKGVDMLAKGGARVQFTQTNTRFGTDKRNSNQIGFYCSEEQYFHQSFSLLHEDGESFLLPAGDHQYPFSFQLPIGLPSSFEGEFGYVRYTIKIVVNRPLHLDYETKVAISVNSIYDLNTVSLANEPVQATDSKTICCWCCASGPISARVWIDKTGHVPGQFVPFCAQVENKSRRQMLGSKVRLVQNTTYHAQGKSRTVVHVLSELHRGAFGASDIWDHFPVAIPPVPPSSLPNCKIIDIDYRIVFTVNPGTFSLNLNVPLNIIIGNVPLRDNFSLFNRPATSINLLTNLSEEAFSTADQYNDLPLPSYQEASFKANICEIDDAVDTNRGGTFAYAPRYLTYQMN